MARIGVFGSFVRGEQRPDTDIDFLLQFEPSQKTFDHLMELSFFLEDLFPNRIEPITPESLTPYIGPQILKEVFRWQGNNAHKIRLADYH